MTIHFLKILNFSWMSQAAYRGFEGVPSGNAEQLKTALTKDADPGEDKKFADKQAESFTDATTGFSLIDHLPNDASGFSATVFKSNAEGSYTIAVRGTEETSLTDLLDADGLGVVLSGQAQLQTISAYRYYKRLTTPSGSVVTYSAAEKNLLTNLLARELAVAAGVALTVIGAIIPGMALNALLKLLLPQSVKDAMAAFALNLDGDTGLGVIPAGAKIDFTGHSLGGHVATLLGNMAKEYGGANTGEIHTFNSPGQNAIPNEVRNWLGIDTSQAALVPTTNIIGEGGLNVTAGLGSMQGSKQEVFIENDGALAGSVLMANHSIVKLSDSLAMYDLYSRLAPGLDAGKIKTLLNGVSNRMGDSLELALDALCRSLLGMNVAATPEGDRDVFHANLNALQDSAAYRALSGSAAVRLTAAQGQDELVSQAGADFGTFLALKYLLPFSIEGAAGTLSGVHADLYAQWQADQVRRAAGATDFVVYTDDYLADRARFLAWKLRLAQEDVDASGTPYTKAPDAWFRDNASNLTLHLGATLTNSTDKPRYLFGADQSTYTERLEGGSSSDRLYGGAGDDILNGGKGSDYLEGGAGLDTYTFAAGDGQDTIFDSDGTGRITIGADTLDGGKETHAGSGQWLSADGRYLYTKHAEAGGRQTLIISCAAGGADRIQVRNFSNGQLGITRNNILYESGTDGLFRDVNDNNIIYDDSYLNRSMGQRLFHDLFSVATHTKRTDDSSATWRDA